MSTFPPQPDPENPEPETPSQGNTGPESAKPTQPPQSNPAQDDPAPETSGPVYETGALFPHSPEPAGLGGTQKLEPPVPEETQPRTQALGPVAQQPERITPNRRWRWGVSGLVIGALVGGVAGGGVALSFGQGGDNTPEVTQQGSEDQVISNPKTANQTSAAAAKALPSVVTVSASDSQGNGSGSGVVVSQDGKILTNQHVATLAGASDSASLEVQTSEGKTYQAKLAGQDPLYDLAVLEVQNADGDEFTPIKFANMDDSNVGSSAIAIGAPLGLPNTVSTGIISNRSRSISIGSSAVKSSPQEDKDQKDDSQDFRIPGQKKDPEGSISINVLQTDAAINHGNSGGALVNDQGELIGINVAIYAPSEKSGSIGLGFAVPGNVAERVAKEMAEKGKASHGQLGLMARSAPANGGKSKAFADGALVSDVVSRSAAEEAGIKRGDIITKVDGKRVSDAVDLTATVRSYPAGETTSISLLRDGKEKTVKVKFDGADG